jgi:transcription initiation factor TFIIIB Brf1 subunit/transcription initiation factor TFIIB
MEDTWKLFDKLTINDEPEIDSQEKMFCFVCKSFDLVFDSSYSSLTCNECGVLVCTLIDKKNEASIAMNEGSNISHFLPKSSLGTSISGNPKMKIRLVNDWWKWEYKEKAFYDDKKFIEDKCYNAKLPQAIVDNALNLYKRISESKDDNGKYYINRGINRVGLMAASVYWGSKMQKQPRSPKEISTIFNLKQTDMTKGCKRFLSLIDHTVLYYNQEMNETRDFVERYCKKLGLNDEYFNKSLEIIKNIDKLQIATNHQPPSVAAATILLMADVMDLNINKKELNAMFKISEVTISKTYNKINPWIRVIADTELTNNAVAERDTVILDDDEIYVT